MRQNRSTLILVILCLAAIPRASSAAGANGLLLPALEGARNAGFTGLKDVDMPPPPADTAALLVKIAQEASPQEILNSYAEQILAFPNLPKRGLRNSYP